MAQLGKYDAKIDTMNLAPIIIRLRKNSSLRSTADHINRYYLKDGDSITAEAIRKWEKRNHIVQQEQPVIPIGVPIDTYNKVVTNHNRSVAQLSRLDGEMYRLRNSVFTDEEEEVINRLIASDGVPASLKTKLEDLLVYDRTNTMTTLLSLYNTAIANDHKISLDMVKVEKEMLNVNNNKMIIDAIVKAVIQVDKELEERDSELSKEFSVPIPTYSIKRRYYEILQENPEIWKTIQKKG